MWTVAAQVSWLSPRVGGHSALSPHSRNEPGELSHPHAMMTAWLLLLLLLARTASRCRMTYILPLCFYLFLSFFLSFFSTINLWGHWTDLNQTWTHIYLWLLFWKFGPNFRAFTPPPALAGENCFLGPSLNFDRTYLCNGTWYQQLERNLPIHIRTPLHAPNLVNVCPEAAENGWQVFAHPLNFPIGRHCQLYRMDVI